MRTNSTPDDLGFLLAKASQRFNELLTERLAKRGFGDVRASFGSVLVPLFAKDDLRLGEVAARSRMSKQAVTGLMRLCEQRDLVSRKRDPGDGRAYRVELTPRGRRLRTVVGEVQSELGDQVVAALGKRNQEALMEGLKGMMDL
jgi:MarR family transcriptional regulator, organic hydroperoxide resistance regulator